MSDPRKPEQEDASSGANEEQSAEKNTTDGGERVQHAAEESAQKGLPYEMPKPKSVD